MGVFKNRIKELRESKHLTQKDMGKLFHLTQSIISHYEAGRKQPSQQTLQQFADFFGVSVDYLLGREKVPIKAINIDGRQYTEDQIKKMIRQAILLEEALKQAKWKPES